MTTPIVLYTEHALKQMGDRGITNEQVEDCLKNSDKTVQQIPNRYKNVMKVDEKHILVVSYEKGVEGIVVVTAFITSQTSKHL